MLSVALLESMSWGRISLSVLGFGVSEVGAVLSLISFSHFVMSSESVGVVLLLRRCVGVWCSACACAEEDVGLKEEEEEEEDSFVMPSVASCDCARAEEDAGLNEEEEEEDSFIAQTVASCVLCACRRRCEA